MFSFGKSFNDGRKHMIGRRWFDRLVQAGKRVGESAFTDTTYEYVRSGPKAKRKVAQESEGTIIAPDWDGDYDYEHACAERALERARRFRQSDMEMFDRGHLNWNEVRPLRKRLYRSDMFLESYPEGEEKLVTKEALKNKNESSRHRRGQERNACSWKNKSREGIGRKTTSEYEAEEKERLAGAPLPTKWDFEQKGFPHNVSSQWARHQPKAHVSWSIGEEMAAGFLKWQREDEERQCEFEKSTLQEIEREFQDALYRSEDFDAVIELKVRYRGGKWNHNEPDPRKISSWDDNDWYMDEAA